jgi:hypothetical protein
MASPLRTVDSEADLEAVLGASAAAGQGSGRALILIGGATFADDDPELSAGIRSFLAALAAACERTGTAVVDGGTDAGVMRWFAEARAAIEGTFLLVGVAPRGAFERSTRTGEPITPADGHSMIVVVPGSRFGDETAWLFATADRLGGGTAPSIVVNGGRLALAEAGQRLDAGHAVIAVAGSGRAADELAGDERLHASGRLRVTHVSADEAALAAILEEMRAR